MKKKQGRKPAGKLKAKPMPPRIEGVEIDPNAPLPAHVFIRLLVTDGPKCAAWLVREFRYRLKTVGLMRFHTPRGRREPVWFQLAIGVLQRRDWNWDVKVGEHAGGTQYTIHWRHWLGRPSVGPTPLVFARGGQG